MVLLDLLQSRARLAATVAELRKRGHAVIVASSSADLDPVQTIRAGAGGCLSRQAEGDELLTAIKVVASGRSYVSAPVGNLLKTPLISPNGNRRFCDSSRTARRTGKSPADSASARTPSIRISTGGGEKTGTRRRSDLTRLAIERGLVDAA